MFIFIVADQVSAGDKDIVGVMIESHINEGNQKLSIGVTKVEELKYGVSVTDACIDFAETEVVLRNLAKAVKERRKVTSNGVKH